LVHERVSAGTDDVSAGDGAVAFDLDFYRADEGFILLEDRSGLLPLAEKSVVDEFMIPAEFAGGATGSAFACATRCRAAATTG